MEHIFVFLARWRGAMEKVHYIKNGRLLVLICSAHQTVIIFSCFAQIRFDQGKMHFLVSFTTFILLFDVSCVFHGICNGLNYSWFSLNFSNFSSRLLYGSHYFAFYIINERWIYMLFALIIMIKLFLTLQKNPWAMSD